MDSVTLPPDSVLCVDLDGTLSRTDSMVECLFLLMKQRPWAMLLLPLWLLRGRAAVKAEIARRVRFDPAILVYNNELLNWLREEKSAGRKLVIASGADERIVKSVAAHLDLFDEIFASDGRINLTGARKAAVLKDRFSDFAYVGDGKVDLHVWKHASTAVLVARSSGREMLLSKQIKFGRVFPAGQSQKSPLRLWIRAVRVHQWTKNMLLFAPLVLAHMIYDVHKLAACAIGFVAFSLCASSVYLLNDLLDLAADRDHPRKRARPFAAGDLPLQQGLVAIPLLLLAAFALAFAVSWQFAGILLFYYALTLAYSVDLKLRTLLDVFALAGLYSIRIIAGGIAAEVEVSAWLLGFSTFIFLSLAIAKRVAELDALKGKSLDTYLHGRGYLVADFNTLSILGIAAGYASVVVLALYISAPEGHQLYPHPQILWLLAPLLLYWVSRVWILTNRGRMVDDPILFAIKDRPSRVVALAAALTVVLAAL